jgi:hypothetical protein
MSKVLSNRSGVKIPHQDMVLLRKGGDLSGFLEPISSRNSGSGC